MTTTLIDISHTIESGMVTYKGLPAPMICDYLSREESRQYYAPGTEFQIGKIELVSNTGTYLDSPFHRYAAGRDLAQLDLASTTNLDAVVIRVDARRRAIDADAVSGVDVRGKAVLIHTGWDSRWRTDAYFEGHPFLTGAAAAALVEGGAALVGIDSFNIDDTADGARPVHSTLLAHAIPIVEHLCNLQSVPEAGTRFFGAPVKIAGMGTFPIRAYVLKAPVL